MGKDIAPAFRRLIRKIPEWWLCDLRTKLSSLNDPSKATQAMIVTINAELLRRKWSRDLG